MVIPALDERDISALRMIRTNWDLKGYAPSMRQLALAIKTTSASVATYRVRILEKRDLLLVPREDGEIVSHAMKLTSLGHLALEQAEAEAEIVEQREIRQALREWIDEMESSS